MRKLEFIGDLSPKEISTLEQLLLEKAGLVRTLRALALAQGELQEEENKNWKMILQRFGLEFSPYFVARLCDGKLYRDIEEEPEPQ